MDLPRESALLRIFIGESEKVDGKPAYEAIVLKARELNMAGATVIRGIMGFGKTSRLHTAKVLEMSSDLPLIIEITDTEDKLTNFIPVLEKMHKGGLVTMEKIKVIHYKNEIKN
jgi:PII-like signaling protein